MLRMRSSAKRSWMSKEKSCRKICETLRSSRVFRKRSRTAENDRLQQLQEVEQRRHDLLSESGEKVTKIQSFQDKKRNLQKENAAARE